jgi:hypothetical protein
MKNPPYKIWRPPMPPIPWVLAALYTEVKRQGSGVDHSSPSTADVKNKWSYNSTPRHALITKSRGKGRFHAFTELRLHCSVTHVIMKFSAFHDTWSFHIVLKGNLQSHRILSHVGAVQSRFVLWTILISSSHLCVRFPSRFFQSAFLQKPQFILQTGRFRDKSIFRKTLHAKKKICDDTNLNTWFTMKDTNNRVI